MTIHKCQGLSLSSVVIDTTQGINTAGQFYVALSRARQLDQVHLVGFQASHIKCQKTCVSKINEMRAEYNRFAAERHLDLAPLPIYNLETEVNCIDSLIPKPVFKAKKPVRLSTELAVEDALQEMEIDIDQPSTSRAPPVRRKQSIPQKRKFNENVALMFRNPRPESCYANTGLQILLYCDGFRNYFETVDSGTLSARQARIVQEMREILSEFNKRQPIVVSIDRLRAAVHPDFAPSTGYHCVTEFLFQLFEFESFPELSRMFKLRMHQTSICTACRTEYAQPTMSELSWSLSKPENIDSISFTDSQMRSLRGVGAESTCAACGTYAIREIEYELQFGEEQRYLMLQLRANVPCKITGFQYNREYFLFGNTSCKWRLRSIAIYHAVHYWAFMRNVNDKWLKADCLANPGVIPDERTATIELDGNPDCACFRNVRVLIFERV